MNGELPYVNAVVQEASEKIPISPLVMVMVTVSAGRTVTLVSSLPLMVSIGFGVAVIVAVGEGLSRLRWATGGSRSEYLSAVAVGVSVGVSVGVLVAVAVGVSVGVAGWGVESVAVAVGVSVGVLVRLLATVCLSAYPLPLEMGSVSGSRMNTVRQLVVAGDWTPSEPAIYRGFPTCCSRTEAWTTVGLYEIFVLVVHVLSVKYAMRALVVTIVRVSEARTVMVESSLPLIVSVGGAVVAVGVTDGVSVAVGVGAVVATRG